MAQGLLRQRRNNNESNPEDALLEEDAELWDTVVREVEIEREAIGRSLEGWPPEGMGSSRQRFLEATRGARSSSGSASGGDSNNPASSSVPLLMSPEELWNTALQQQRNFQPTWSNRTRNAASTIEIVSPQIATVTAGAGEGRALRAEPALPRDMPSVSNNESLSISQSNHRIVGFRVAFDHPTTEDGHSMGGCYLVGVTTSAFNAYNESNALQQSPFFWGIEDGGNKYEGPRHASRRGGRRMSPTYATELGLAPRNAHGVLFGARDVVSVVCDLTSRTMCFWRNETYLGPLVQGLPRGGALYPVVVPFNNRVSVAIGPLSQDLLPLLSEHSNRYRKQMEQAQAVVRDRLEAERHLLLSSEDGTLTQSLRNILLEIWKLYQPLGNEKTSTGHSSLPYQEAARLWYRCGMGVSSLDLILKEKQSDDEKSPLPELHFSDWETVLQKVLQEDEAAVIASTGSTSRSNNSPSAVEKGDRVQLVEGYEKYGDAAGGPLRPSDRGVVVELQGSPNGERYVTCESDLCLSILERVVY